MKYEQAIDQYSFALGSSLLPIQFTGQPEQPVTLLKEAYKELFDIFYGKKDKTTRVTCWGIDDDMSWKTITRYPIEPITLYDGTGINRPSLLFTPYCVFRQKNKTHSSNSTLWN